MSCNQFECNIHIAGLAPAACVTELLENDTELLGANRIRLTAGINVKVSAHRAAVALVITTLLLRHLTPDD